MHRILGSPENVETLVENKQVNPETLVHVHLVSLADLELGQIWVGASAGIHNVEYDFKRLYVHQQGRTEHFQSSAERFQERAMRGFCKHIRCWSGQGVEHQRGADVPAQLLVLVVTVYLCDKVASCRKWVGSRGYRDAC